MIEVPSDRGPDLRDAPSDRPRPDAAQLWGGRPELGDLVDDSHLSATTTVETVSGDHRRVAPGRFVFVPRQLLAFLPQPGAFGGVGGLTGVDLAQPGVTLRIAYRTAAAGPIGQALLESITERRGSPRYHCPCHEWVSLSARFHLGAIGD
ncbi:hypothetical protein [Williamsia sp.]|uniref:hypothetical protein n=1 Tax=Williamsia sp. TaxID=1872085 RepID=UPI001A25257B|nr:hypothetical protein [Williamsia sp.]MBJ7287565.1 hypothetical protein [Williamsia sp.]